MPALGCNFDQSAVHRQALEVALEIGRADDVDDDVDTATAGQFRNAFGEVCRPVIDGSVRAQSHARSAFLVVAGGRVGARPELARQLNGRDADTAAAAVYQHRLAARETPMDEQVGPDGEVRFGQGRGTNGVVARWPGQALRDRRSAVLGVSAAIRQRAHTIADREALRFTPKRDDFTCHLETNDRARAGRRRVQPLALRNVGAVHACRQHADQDFVRSGLRHCRRADRQDFGSAGGSRGNVAHGLGNHGVSIVDIGGIEPRQS